MTTLAHNPVSTSTPNAAAVEVAVRWGDDLIHVCHLAPARAYFIGSADGCDFAVAELERTALVTVEDGRAFAMKDGERVELALGNTVVVAIGALRFEVKATDAEKRVAKNERRPGRGFAAVAMSAMVHAGLLAATAFLMPALGATADDTVTEEQRYLMQQYLDSAAEIEREAMPGDAMPGAPGDGDPTAPADAIKVPGQGGPGASRPGNPLLPRGPVGGERMSRNELVQYAANFGMNELLIGEPGGPVASEWLLPTAGDGSIGDPTVWGGDLVGNPLELGNPGGEGSDMRGNWYTNAGFPSLDRCASPPCGADGFRGTHLSRARHEATSPIMRAEKTEIDSVTIPREIIQRVVRANFGRFRGCYENGLRKNPSLEGRVAVRFLINRDGTVGGSSDAGSSIGDSAVVSCVVSAFRGLSFPAPERGVVTVTYPILFVAPGA